MTARSCDVAHICKHAVQFFSAQIYTMRCQHPRQKKLAQHRVYSIKFAAVAYVAANVMLLFAFVYDTLCWARIASTASEVTRSSKFHRPRCRMPNLNGHSLHAVSSRPMLNVARATELATMQEASQASFAFNPQMIQRASSGP